MYPNPENNFSKYVFISVIILLVGIVILILMGGVFTSINTSLPTEPTITPPSTPTGQEDISSIDEILHQARSASIAYNAPETMQLDETVIIQLLLNPTISEEELSKQVEESGTITTGTIQITPLMKAELKARDGQAFAIQSLHDTPEQPVTVNETAKWQWQVTAKEGGLQGLTLVIYRLIKYDDKDYWREVETYKSDIFVKVSIQQRFLAFDWKWLGGLLLTSLIIPLFLRWWEKRKSRAKKK